MNKNRCIVTWTKSIHSIYNIYMSIYLLIHNSQWIASHHKSCQPANTRRENGKVYEKHQYFSIYIVRYTNISTEQLFFFRIIIWCDAIKFHSDIHWTSGKYQWGVWVVKTIFLVPSFLGFFLFCCFFLSAHSARLKCTSFFFWYNLSWHFCCCCCCRRRLRCSYCCTVWKSKGKRCVTQSNRNLSSTKKKTVPCLKEEILTLFTLVVAVFFFFFFSTLFQVELFNI